MYRFVNIIEHHLKHDTAGLYISIKSARGMKHASIMSSYIAAIVFLRTNYICKKKRKNKSENLVESTRFQFFRPIYRFFGCWAHLKIFADVDDLFRLMDN